MTEALGCGGLMALTLITLWSFRARAPLMRALVEAALLLAIGAFLVWRGTSPLTRVGSIPAGIDGAWLKALAVVWWLVGARLVIVVTAIARGRDPRAREARLFSDLLSVAIYITTILIILNSVLDLPVNGVLATSGVIAIVIGLALQNTLADVFSGIAVGIEQPFHVGDRVSLGDGVEGLIVQMNWRSVRIQTDADDLATIPNSIVAKGQIINRSVPTRRRGATVEITTRSDASSELVIELLRQATMLCPEVLAKPAPTLTIRRSGLNSSTYAATFFVADSPALTNAKSLLIRQMRRLLRHGGVVRGTPPSVPELLGSLVLFEALSRDEVESLAGKVAMLEVEPGDTVFEQNSSGDSVYVIRAGVMEISRHRDGDPDATLGRIGPGEYIGELGLITGGPRPVTMRAATHGVVLELPADAVRALLASNGALNAAMERSVRRGMALLDRDDAARAAHPAEQTSALFARIRSFFGV